jgi:carbonic anhydrase/acetyltransferase-like protein (isoleucine patch superfamily)
MTGALHPHLSESPRIDPTAYVAPGARIVGDVTIGPRSSVWFNAVLRADTDAIRIGEATNVQDGAVLHTDLGRPCVLGDRCTVGHLAVVHGCRVEDDCLVGMGAVVLSGAAIGTESLVAAGAVVPEGKEFGARSLIVGAPARSIRRLSDEDVERLIRPSVRHYLQFARDYSSTNVSQPT